MIADRFLDSSLAYQGAARGLGIEHVLQINRTAVGDCLPHLSLVLETPTATASARRQRTADRIEAEGDGFQERVAAGYRALVTLFPERIRPVAGEGSVEEVHARVMTALEPLL